MSVHAGEKASSKECASIVGFYAGRNILVTGGTGFLGKVLLEKLLRSCPDVGEIFLLMRPKKGLSIDDRLRKILKMPLFDKLRQENPSSFEKLIPILGDVKIEGLGIPPIERRTIIERVSIIFHIAANVRFSEALKTDVYSNIRSTRDICILAGSMKKLVALVHVSTAYAQVDKPVVEEVVYPPLTDWKKTLRMIDTVDDETMRILTQKYAGSMPNTYTFSKRLAEQVINDYSKDVPSVIFRPTIVISSYREPIPGWLDNFNGPVSMLIGGGKGILRVVHLQPDMAGDFIPVDLSISIMIIAAWKRGLQTVTKDPSVHVYNGSSHGIYRMTYRQLISYGYRKNEETPIEGCIWYPNTIMTTSNIFHYVMTLLLHVLPAVIIDKALEVMGHQPMLMKIQKTVYSSSIFLHYFVHNEWIFRNENMLNALASVPPAEQDIFNYDFSNLNMEEYFEDCLKGAKLYLLNEDIARLKEAKQHYNRMKWIDRIFRISLIVLLIWAFGETVISFLTF